MLPSKIQLIKWWKRSGLLIRIGVFGLCALMLSALVYWQRPFDEQYNLGGNLLIFAVVNINLIILCVLIFLVGRNIVKLIFDRRRNILGSKLRQRLVIAFVGLALIPTVLLFILASGLLSRALEDWFSAQVDRTVSSAVVLGQEHFGLVRGILGKALHRARDEVEAKPLVYAESDLLQQFFLKVLSDHDLDGLSIVGMENESLFSVKREQEDSIAKDVFVDIDTELISLARQDQGKVIYQSDKGKLYVQAYLGVVYQAQEVVLVANKFIEPDLVQALGTVNAAFKEYEQIKLFKNPVKSSYLITLAMITGLILFSAMWFGFYIAKELSVPIQRLAEGTEAVAQGNLDYYVRPTGDDEIAILVRSFNKMTADLRSSRAEVERRRIYTETIMANLAIGVIGVDREQSVTSINNAAAELFSSGDLKGALRREIRDVLGEVVYDQIVPMITRVLDENLSAASIFERRLEISSDKGDRNIICTIGQLKGPEGDVIGAVILFDDVTDLTKAQQLAVWREVARRIAHEIKNPLTPIRLSAQRLQNLAVSEDGIGSLVQESTKTIVENVDSINRLADEFSRFARMPSSEFRKNDLNLLISQVFADLC